VPATDDWETGPTTPAADDWEAEIVDTQVPSEQFSLNFSKIEYSYQPQGADGRAQGGPIVAGWDVKGNQKV
jgi:type VI protein secretion system component Hcp